jgi:hypothetical protein
MAILVLMMVGLSYLELPDQGCTGDPAGKCGTQVSTHWIG